MKRTFTVFALLIAALFVFASCGKSVSETKTVRDVVQSQDELPQKAVVERRDISIASYYGGQVFYGISQLSFPSEGNFETFKVGLGETVKKGQVLATTQNEMSKKQYDELKSTADNLKKNYEYNLEIKTLELEILEAELDKIYDSLKEMDPTSKTFSNACVQAGRKSRDIEKKKLEISQLTETYNFEYPYYNNKVKAYKKTMGKNVIESPCDGIVVAIENIQTGSYVDSDTYCIAVADPSVLCVSCDYLSDNYIEMYPRIYALVDGEYYETEYLPMNTEVYNKLSANEETIYTTFKILNSGESVEVGDYAYITVIRNQVLDAVSIPAFALFGDTGGRFVYVDGENGKEKRYIEMGITNGAYTEVRGGLEEGEVIYVDR